MDVAEVEKLVDELFDKPNIDEETSKRIAKKLIVKLLTTQMRLADAVERLSKQ